MQANFIFVIIYMYQVTTKLAHGLYQSATVVDYNLNLKFLIIGDVKYPACTRLWNIENHRSLVIENKCEQALHICTVVCTMWSPYLGISCQSADGVTFTFGLWQLAFVILTNQVQALPNILKSVQI